MVNEIDHGRGQAGSPVVYTQDWHPPSTPHFAKDGGIWPVHCVADTWGAQLHPDLVVRGPVVRKGTGGEDGYSGFSMRDPETGETSPTELDGLLREAGAERARHRRAGDRLLRRRRPRSTPRERGFAATVSRRASAPWT